MKENGISTTLKWTGYCIIAAGVISAFVIGSKTQDGLLAFAGILSGFIFGIGFVGFGEAIRLLSVIANNQEIYTDEEQDDDENDDEDSE